jgi:hypothetical protein
LAAGLKAKRTLSAGIEGGGKPGLGAAGFGNGRTGDGAGCDGSGGCSGGDGLEISGPLNFILLEFELASGNSPIGEANDKGQLQ